MNDDNNWALLYFPSDGLAFPQNPEEFMTRPPERRIMRLVTEDGTQQDYPIADNWALQYYTMEVFKHPAINWAGKLFTIHNGGMLQRMIHWTELRMRAIGEPAPVWTIPATIDLVEAFHGRSILTYEQRRGFTVNELRQWVWGDSDAIDNKEELETLIRTCQIL